MSDPFIGEIRMAGFNFAPRGWALCNGQVLPIASNTALFSLLGTQFGGNGSTTFGLPDLRCRMPIHQGQGPGLAPHVMGEAAGVETVTLTTSQMPSHNHVPGGTTTAGDDRDPRGHLWASSSVNRYSTNTPNTTMHPTAIGPAGNGQPHTNMPPYLAVTFIIALQGIFPSRN